MSNESIYVVVETLRRRETSGKRIADAPASGCAAAMGRQGPSLGTQTMRGWKRRLKLSDVTLQSALSLTLTGAAVGCIWVFLIGVGLGRPPSSVVAGPRVPCDGGPPARGAEAAVRGRWSSPKS